LRVTDVNMETSPFLVDGNNPYFFSGTAPLNEKIYGFSTDLGDVDSYYLDARPGETYLISVSGVGADIFDPKLVIRNRAGEVVASSSGMPGSYDPVISFKPELGGGYKIDVVNEDDISGSFPFVFSIQEGSYSNPYSRSYHALTDPITGLQDLETKASFDSAIGDSVLTKKELENLLYSAGDGGEVSAQEFNDLRVISGNLSSYLAPDTATYYQQIFDNVVLGSVANEYYTGGRLKADPLGDLHAGSSSEQLDKLVGKWFLGTDLPSPFMSADAAAGKKDVTGIYVAASGRLFDSPIEFTDIHQGTLGDCWFLAATASTAAHAPETISSLFRDNGDGTYGVHFKALGEGWQSLSTQEHWVTVNRQLPVNSKNPEQLEGVGSTPQRLITDELWPSLLEKAAAQASELGIFSVVRGENKDLNSYASLAGGYSEGLLMLQPGSLVSASANTNYVENLYAGSDVTLLKSALDWRAYLGRYQAAIDSGNGPAVIGSDYTTDPALNPRSKFDTSVDLGFIAKHEYAIVDYSSDSGLIDIYNPWGPSGKNGFGPFVSPFRVSTGDLYSKVYARGVDDIGFIVQ